MYEKRKTKERRRRGKPQGIMPALTSELMAVLGIIALMLWVSPTERKRELSEPQLALPTKVAPENQHSEPVQYIEPVRYTEPARYAMPTPNAEQASFAMPTHYVESRHW